MNIRTDDIAAFEEYLYQNEKSEKTIEKYVRDIRTFYRFLRQDGRQEETCRDAGEGLNPGEQPDGGDELNPGEQLNPGQVVRYKEYLRTCYKVSSANSMITALNSYLVFIGRKDCCLRTFKAQRKIFLEEERELTKAEYMRLIRAAEQSGNIRLSCILQTIGSTGIRIGELQYITAEALRRNMVTICFKGKSRCIILPKQLVQLLKDYCRKRHVTTGSIFITRSGRPVDRRNVWAEMKRLCAGAGVQASKVFPHSLRHLFARTYYEKEKDVIRLADYLGHSNVETTRRYTMISSMEACQRSLELGMLLGGSPGHLNRDIKITT